jgi:mannonate dehydratase
MRLASVLTPLSDYHLRLAAQCGVEDIVIRYPGPELSALIAVKERIESFGMRGSVVEGYLPIENIKLGNEERDAEIEEMIRLVRHMGEAKIPLLCYNFMAGTDWVRTSTTVQDRGGALVTAFDLREVKRALSLTAAKENVAFQSVSADQLWDNLEYFLKRILPMAEDAGVVLAMHPDDPPLDELLGRARIMNRVENMERLVAMVPSPSNAICFCQGTFAAMDVDIPATIRRLGKHIRYVHFRDVRGTRDNFVETFHDNGPTDMAAAMRAYRDIGFDGPMRPDHVPQLVGEEEGEPGYTMLGRLFAYGYMRGLIQAVVNE